MSHCTVHLQYLREGPSLASCRSPESVRWGQSDRESSLSWGQCREMALTPRSVMLVHFLRYRWLMAGQLDSSLSKKGNDKKQKRYSR